MKPMQFIPYPRSARPCAFAMSILALCSAFVLDASAEPPVTAGKKPAATGKKAAATGKKPAAETAFRSKSKTIMLPGDVPLVLHSVPGGLWFAETETTRAQWTAVMGTDAPGKRALDAADAGEDGEFPVAAVSYFDALSYARAINEIDSVRKAELAFRLPTTDEWLAACRAGGAGGFGLLADGTAGTPETLGWTTLDDGIHPVGRKAANAWGLRDMIGNVEEWTSTRHMIGSIWLAPYQETCGGSILAFRATGADGTKAYYRASDSLPIFGFRLCAVRGDPAAAEVRAQVLAKDPAEAMKEVEAMLADPAVPIKDVVKKGMELAGKDRPFARAVAVAVDSAVTDDLENGGSRSKSFFEEQAKEAEARHQACGLGIFPAIDLEIGRCELLLGLGCSKRDLCGRFGMQAGLLGNLNTGSFDGIQIGLLSNATGMDSVGIQIAGFTNADIMDYSGIQVALLRNQVNGTMAGLQLGAYNVAGSLYGAQIGLVNVVRRGGGGIQVGLWNSVGDRVFPLVNIVF